MGYNHGRFMFEPYKGKKESCGVRVPAEKR